MRELLLKLSLCPILLLFFFWPKERAKDPLPPVELRRLLSVQMPRIFNRPPLSRDVINATELFDKASSNVLFCPWNELSTPLVLRLSAPNLSPVEVAILLAPNSADEVYGLLEILTEINQVRKEKPIKLRLVARNKESIKGLMIDKRHLETVIPSPYLGTQSAFWLRDFVFPAFDAYDRRAFVETHFKQKKLGTTLQLAKIFKGKLVSPKNIDFACAGNAGGNILITPDNTLLVGNTMTDEMLSYLRSFRNVDKTVVLDTNWYYFGHLDTTLAIVPTKKSPCGYIFVVASSKLGTELLGNIVESELEQELISVLEHLYRFRCSCPNAFDTDDAILGMKTFEDLALAYRQLHGFHSSRGAQIIRACNEASSELNNLVTTLAKECDVPIVRIPALYTEGPYGLVADLTPALANMVILDDHLIVPDALLPVFRNYTKKVIEEFGCHVHFLPSGTFHNLRGQIHCATITIRDFKSNVTRGNPKR